MSGICGLFHPNQAPVAEADVAMMSATLDQRGPDGTGRWCADAVGFGHTLLATTPEALHESQPLRHAETGCTIVADVRLDYRSELLDTLGLGASAPIGDAELVLRGYLAWGEACLDRLFGDFAFAIWDPRGQVLFCARDRFGARPFYYHYARGARFVFSSDARSIVALPQVPFAIDEGRIADFIVEQLEWIDYTSTFFEGVLRLPPAHKLVVGQSGMKISEYWDPVPGPELRYASEAEYAEGFLEVFSRAVEERIRVPGSRVGTTLSGGMDSGSVTAIAHGLLAQTGKRPLNVYSLARRRGVACTESQRIYATLDYLGLDGTQIIADEHASVSKDIADNLAEPFDGQFLFLKAIYDAAKLDDVRVVLDGAAGDLVFGPGAYIARLLRRGRFSEAWREVVAEQAFWELPAPHREFLRYLGSAFAPTPVKTLLRKPRQRREERGYVAASLIQPEFARRIDIEARFKRMRETFAGLLSNEPGLERVRKMRPNLTAGRERYARIAAAAGVEGRDPFTDQRVVDFCSGLPDHLAARGGWPKYLLRVATEGMLPDLVRWSQGKPHIGGLYNETFLRNLIRRGNCRRELLEHGLESYVDPARLQTAWTAFESGGDAEPVHSACILLRWLEKSVTRPVVNDRAFG